MISSLISLFHLNNISFKVILNTLQFRDVVDLILTALMIYILIIFLRRTKSVPVVLGVFIILIIYSLSYWFNLSLTYRILQTFLGAIVIILVIIFQDEIKRFFYLLGSMNINRNRLRLNPKSIDILVNTIWTLANRKIGALIVIPGKETISPYLIGGIDINAKISEPLILALFNDKAPTHDGALIIDNDIIQKFAVYLPLSKDTNQLKNFGTRHRAALGIAEKTDSLSIIVSEEKGTVSVAHNGNLIMMHNKEELENLLKEFLNTLTILNKSNFIIRWIRFLLNNVLSIIISGILAIIIWLSFSYPNLGIIQKNFTVPIEFINIPSNFIVSNLIPKEVNVTLAGKSQDFKLLDPNTIKISIDLKDITQKKNYIITLNSSYIKYPPVLNIVSFDPKKIQFTVSEKIIENTTTTIIKIPR